MLWSQSRYDYKTYYSASSEEKENFDYEKTSDLHSTIVSNLSITGSGTTTHLYLQRYKRNTWQRWTESCTIECKSKHLLKTAIEKHFSWHSDHTAEERRNMAYKAWLFIMTWKEERRLKNILKKIVKGHSLPFYPWSADSCHNGMPFFVVKHGTSDIHIVLYYSTHHSIPGSIIRVSPWLCPFHVKSIKFIHYISLKIAPQAHEHYVTLNISLNTSRIAMWNRNAVSRCRLYVCLKYNWNGSWIFCVTKVITRTGRPLMFRRCRTRISKGYDEAIVPWVTADAGSLK